MPLRGQLPKRIPAERKHLSKKCRPAGINTTARHEGELLVAGGNRCEGLTMKRQENMNVGEGKGNMKDPLMGTGIRTSHKKGRRKG